MLAVIRLTGMLAVHSDAVWSTVAATSASSSYDLHPHDLMIHTVTGNSVTSQCMDTQTYTLIKVTATPTRHVLNVI